MLLINRKTKINYYKFRFFFVIIKTGCEKMELYRGTKISGLKIMEPRKVNHGEAYVYATTDKIEALIYSVKGGNLNYTNIYGYDDGKRCLIERKKDALKNIFQTEGRYYILDDSTFIKHNELGVGDNEYISKEKVKVLDEIIIPNVYEYLKELEKNKKLKIYLYPDRPKEYPKDDSDLIECAIIMYLQGTNIDDSFEMLEKYHPELHDRIIEYKEYIKSNSKETIKSNLKFFK